MNRNHLYRCFTAALASFVVAACGAGDPTDSSPDGVQAGRTGAPGMFICDIPLPGGMPVDLLIPAMEIDRTYQSDRPGFVHQWIAFSPRPDGNLWAGAVLKFQSTAQAEAFSDWLDDGFVLHGVKFWERPYFVMGHECHVWEVLESVDRPSNDASQVTIRIERFPVFGAARADLRAWFAGVRTEAMRRGNSSVTLLYSEDRRMASLLYFDDVPRPRRGLGNPNPIAARPPFVADDVFDQSGWTLVSWFPFEAGDHGRPALWPMPGVEAFPGDGVCSVSRHESSRTTADCLATCGNAAEELGETVDNCPGDVRPFH